MGPLGSEATRRAPPKRPRAAALPKARRIALPVQEGINLRLQSWLHSRIIPVQQPAQTPKKGAFLTTSAARAGRCSINAVGQPAEGQ